MNKELSHTLLKDILAIPTVNGENSEQPLAVFIADYLNNHAIEAYTDQKNVYAAIEGSTSDRIVLFNGHMDTVPYGDKTQWNTDPAVPTERNSRLYGRGASDMKSGLSAIIAALCDIADKGQKPRRTVFFIGTADEEKNGTGAKQAVLKIPFKKTDLLLIGEPTGGTIGLAQKGCIWMNCEIKGKTSHSAYPEQGINALDAGTEFVYRLKQFIQQWTHPLLGSATVSLNILNGGIAPNMVPDTCKLLADIRTVPALTEQKVLDYAVPLAAKMENEIPGLSIAVKIVNARKALETASDDSVTKDIRSCIAKVSGTIPPDTGINFFTDASILVNAYPEIPVILLGPGQQTLAHKPNEYVEWTQYDTAVQIYKEIMLS